MGYTSFPEINAYVEQRITDPMLCKSGAHSYLKIFQHALSYALNGWTRLLLPNKWHWPVPALLIYHYAKGLRGHASPVLSKPVLIIDQGRVYTSTTGEKQSHYFHRILRELGQENVSTLNLNPEHGLRCDWDKNHLLPLRGKPDSAERLMMLEVKALADKVRCGTHFSASEKDYILSSLHVFYESFVFHYRLLKASNVRTVYFIAHYHNEGLIAACEKLNIRSVEIQHGLIAENDLYYIYPPSLRDATQNAFFPDSFLLYGPYWKEILKQGSEYREDRVKVAGNYLSGGNNTVSKEFGKENIVLIGAQKNMEGDYLPYLRHLKERFHHDGWKIIVKLHPLEKEVAAYRALEGGALSIAPHNARLDDLLRRAKIQISIYSTTLYDALGYGVVNFSLQQHGYAQDYAADIVKHRVAFPLLFNDDPVDLYSTVRLQELRQREEVYAPFNPQALS
jgi:hypothetical protein